MKYVIYFIIIAVAIFFVHKFLNRFKYSKVGSFALVTGGVKTGKSTFSVGLVLREYKSRVRAVKIKNFFRKIFNRELKELPLIYSNVPLACPYVQITRDMLLRKKRLVYGSVCYFQESSLVADSMLYRDGKLNEQLLLFFKLFGHETKGGVCILDTQCVSDNHMSVKRVLSNYFYIHHLTKWIPFFLVAYVREFRYSEDNSVIGVDDKDSEETLKRVIISKRVWKKFDCYCYSVLTDDLPVEKTIIANSKSTQDLKAHKIVSFRDSELFACGGVSKSDKVKKFLDTKGDFENDKEKI